MVVQFSFVTQTHEEKDHTETHLRTGLQTVPVFFEERGYVRAIVRIMPFKSCFEKVVQFIGKVMW